MDLDVASLKTFVRVAELQSFTQAAKQLGMPKARASAQVQRLEVELGTQLLQRSTRVVRPTPEGEQLVARARAFLVEADDIASLFQVGRGLRGQVRIELPPIVARDMVIPKVPELLARHPQLQLHIGASDRIVAALRDGYDIVLRIGPVNEPGLVGRRLGEVQTMNAASPAYLHRHGTPRTLAELRSHVVVHYAADPLPVFEYLQDGAYLELPMRSTITVDNFDAYEAAVIAGLGIGQMPRHGAARHQHRLVEILPDLVARSSPISLLHTHGRSVPRRVRAVMGWLTELLAPMVNDVVAADARR